MRKARVRVGSRTFRKFWPRDEPITDGTVRCVICGQIDEDGLHDNALCPATQQTSTGPNQ